MMMANYTIWANATTKNGFAADEIISCLQKSIRRGMVEEACQYAYELYTSGPALLEKVWHRLLWKTSDSAIWTRQERSIP